MGVHTAFAVHHTGCGPSEDNGRRASGTFADTDELCEKTAKRRGFCAVSLLYLRRVRPPGRWVEWREAKGVEELLLFRWLRYAPMMDASRTGHRVCVTAQTGVRENRPPSGIYPSDRKKDAPAGARAELAGHETAIREPAGSHGIRCALPPLRPMFDRCQIVQEDEPTRGGRRDHLARSLFLGGFHVDEQESERAVRPESGEIACKDVDPRVPIEDGLSRVGQHRVLFRGPQLSTKRKSAREVRSADPDPRAQLCHPCPGWELEAQHGQELTGLVETRPVESEGVSLRAGLSDPGWHARRNGPWPGPTGTPRLGHYLSSPAFRAWTIAWLGGSPFTITQYA